MPNSIPFSVQGYILEKSIGQGNAGTVYRARSSISNSKSSDSKQYAVKVIPRSKVRQPVRREVAIHIRLRHPNIIRLHRVIQTSNSPQSTLVPSPTPTALALVMEQATAGDMFTEVSSAGCLHPRVVRRRLRDITAALQYLHKHSVVHLDIKLENVVITNSSSAKLIDFGCARDMNDKSESAQLSALGGTLHYLPPEVLESSKTSPLPSSDAWSLGVLAYTALAGHYPFSPTGTDSSQDNDEAIRHRIINCPPHRLPSSIRLPSDLHRIVFGLLEKDPRKRMTIHHVVTELERSNDFSRHRTIVPSQKFAPSKHAVCDCPSERPRSPAAATEADFTICTCGQQQTLDDALKVVDSIQRNRMRAARDVHRYLSDLDKSSSNQRRHSSSRNVGEERSSRTISVASRR